jgi:hypothetical protein
VPKLKERFFAVPEGKIYPEWFEAGDIVTGSVAKAAAERGILDKEENKAVERAPETAARGRPRKF